MDLSKVNIWIDFILNVDAEKMSYKSIRALELVKNEVNKNTETAKAVGHDLLVSLQKAEIKLLEEFLQTLQDIYNTNDMVSLQTKLELHFENIDNRLLNEYHHNTEISLLSR